MEQGVLDPAPVWTNLKTFLPIARRLCGKVDIITGGYPCQPFSLAGKRGGADDPRHLWPYIEKIIGAIRPVCCFFENVPGHINLGYREVRNDLERLGYWVEQGIFSAAEVGAPHRRKRLFILAVDNTKCSGLEGQSWNGIGQERWSEQGRSVTERSIFPAKYGQNQMEWEHQRTVESRLGFTVNGYNYREDLLRMAGNGVVEQQAELAFRTLMAKLPANLHPVIQPPGKG